MRLGTVALTGAGDLPGPGRDGPRAIASRRPGLNGRALVGGFLVAASAVGLFAAYSGASPGQPHRYVVARSDLPVGRRLSAEDLSTQPAGLPPGAASQAFQDPRPLVGRVLVAPLLAGELVQRSDVAPSWPGQRQVSFPIDDSRAVGGALDPGDRVDVVVTYGSGPGATTAVAAQSVEVVSVAPAGSGSLGGEGQEVVTLSLDPSVDPRSVVQAVNQGQVVLVRSTGAPPLADPGPWAPGGAGDTGALLGPPPSAGGTPGG
jgi:Flp pilus assembly protein CpaB